MTTWYVDFINGNNANAGNSFATRCQTLAGIHAKALAAGDEVRFMKSPDAVNTGITAKFTGTQMVLLDSPVTQVLNDNGSFGFSNMYSVIGSGNWNTLIEGAGTYIAAGNMVWNDPTMYNVAKSTDGHNWNVLPAGTFPASTPFNTSAYINGTFVLIATGNSYTSTDAGLTWTTRSMPSSATWSLTATGNNTIVTVASGSTSSAYSTNNGASWTAVSLPVSNAWLSLTHNGSVFCLTGTTLGVCYTSPDGITWTSRSMPATASYIAVWAPGLSKFVALSVSSTNGATSPDGITWTSFVGPNGPIKGLIASNNMIVSYLTSNAISYQSFDGTTWFTNSHSSSASWKAGIFAGGFFYVMRSDGVMTLMKDITTAVNPLWISSTNVTATLALSPKAVLTTHAQIAAGFSTGLAMRSLAINDGAGFQQVSFQVKQTAGTLLTAGNYSLTLCSDTSAAVPVYTIPIPASSSLNSVVTVTMDLGSPIPAATIKSIGLTRATNTGAQTVSVFNIAVTTAAGSSTEITHNHLVSTSSTGPWYPVTVIGTNFIQSGVSSTGAFQSTNGQMAPGPAEVGTYTLYTRLPLLTPQAHIATSAGSATPGTTAKSGASGNPIIHTGGWNTTDMSTQTGDTFLSGVNGFGYGISVTTNNLSFDKLNYVNFQRGFNMSQVGVDGITYIANSASACSGEGVYLGGTLGWANNNWIVSVDHVCSNVGGTSSGAILFKGAFRNSSFTFTNVNSTVGNAIYCNTQTVIGRSNLTVTNVSNTQDSHLVLVGLLTSTATFGTIKRASFGRGGGNTSPFVLTNISDSSIVIDKVLESTANSSLGGLLGSCFIINEFSGGGNTWTLFTLTGSNANSKVTYLNGPRYQYGASSGTMFSNFTLVGTVKPTLSTAVTLGFDTNVNQVTYANPSNCMSHTYEYGNMTPNATIRHTASGYSWKVVGGSLSSVRALSMQGLLGKVFLQNGITTTISVWAYKENAAVTGGLMISGCQIAGIPNTVYVDNPGAVGVWTQISLAVTPTEDGLVEVKGYSFGSSSFATYFDDMSIS